jgi:hypothetical protein
MEDAIVRPDSSMNLFVNPNSFGWPLSVLGVFGSLMEFAVFRYSTCRITRPLINDLWIGAILPPLADRDLRKSKLCHHPRGDRDREHFGGLTSR